MGDEGEKTEPQRQKQERPSAAEIFHGKDAVIGRELVELLVADEVGVPIWYHDYRKSDKKVNVTVDREVGSEDFTVRQREENNDQLLGIVIPAANSKNEFLYLGIFEDDFVFRSGERNLAEYDPELNTRREIGYQKFVDIITHTDIPSTPEMWKLEILFRAHEDPQKFDAMVTDAVEKRRLIREAIRKSRAEIRQNLKDKLFGRAD